MKLLDGKLARDFYKARLTKKVSNLRARGIHPRLAIIQIGDIKESNIYIEQKKKFGADIGVEVDHIKLDESVSQETIASRIEKLSRDPLTTGIILQLPIPAHLDKLALINLIDPKKDVDGLTDENVNLLDRGTPRFIPATAKGVLALLDFYSIDVKGKRVVVFGRSRLVGHPTAELLRIRGAYVDVCHSKTENPQEISRSADILVVAIGKPCYITPDFVKEGAVVVDVGINSVDGTNKSVGDVSYESVKTKVSAISPVPGGVGPMTVLSLFDNLIASVEISS